MVESSPRSTCIGWLYTNNPFYALSAALMLIAVRAGYGKLEIGLINCWVMMGVLAAYTLLLATVGVLIVRLGKVWEDARSILMLLLLMFLAVSISADDLFVKMTSARVGANLLALGFLFTIAVTWGVLRGARIRLSWRYLIPYVLFFALFFVAPWWCSPEIHGWKKGILNWQVFLFPQVAAVIGLTLLPAVRRGPRGVEQNGTPWPWPWFPWSAFGVIGLAVAIRSFALAMTFGQTGQIWHDIKGRNGIVFDTIWGPYFLVPFAFVVMLLVLETQLSLGRIQRATRVLMASPLLLLISLPWSNGQAFQEFLRTVTKSIGSPVWLTIWLLLLFHGWGMWRRVPGAAGGLIAGLLLLTVVNSATVNRHTLGPVQPVPMFAAGSLLAYLAIRRRSSAGTMIAAGLLTLATVVFLTDAGFTRFRFATCYHMLLVSSVAIGLLFQDQFARTLRFVGAAALPLTSLIVLASSSADVVPVVWRLLYVILLAGSGLACAKVFRDRWYLYSSTATAATFGYGLMMFGFREAASHVGRTAMTAFSWSAGAFLIALLISAHKANWFPRRWLPDYNGGPPPGLANASDGLDSLSILADEQRFDDG